MTLQSALTITQALGRSPMINETATGTLVPTLGKLDTTEPQAISNKSTRRRRNDAPPVNIAALPAVITWGDEASLNEEQAACFLGCAPATLALVRCQRRWPLPFARIGRCIRYKLGDLRAFVAARTV